MFTAELCSALYGTYLCSMVFPEACVIFVKHITKANVILDIRITAGWLRTPRVSEINNNIYIFTHVRGSGSRVYYLGLTLSTETALEVDKKKYCSPSTFVLKTAKSCTICGPKDTCEFFWTCELNMLKCKLINFSK